MTGNHRYMVAGSRPWNRRVFDEVIARYPGEWQFASCVDELTPQALAAFAPSYVFFLHWSWIVPAGIFDEYECVVFHMTDLPYGRGGSPLQNLVVRGHHTTKLTALRMVEELDAGPVYMKEDLSLEGSAEEIYIRASYLSANMICRIIENQAKPKPQKGTPIVFKRRKPRESRIQESASLGELHDFIRMLDAEGYPHAFLEHAGFRYEFTRSALKDGRIDADVTITPLEDSKT